MKKLAALAIERAEIIKSILSPIQCRNTISPPSAPDLTDEEEQSSVIFDKTIFPRVPTDGLIYQQVNLNYFLELGLLGLNQTIPPQPSTSTFNSPQNSQKRSRRRWSDQNKERGLSKGEMCVLASTSRINALTYVPFIEQCDLKEQFFLTIPFTDKDGLLSLSEKQKKNLKGWMRPDEFTFDPRIIDRIDSGTIKQTIITG